MLLRILCVKIEDLVFPLKKYEQTVREGYKDFGFDEKILDEAIKYSDR